MERWGSRNHETDFRTWTENLIRNNDQNERPQVGEVTNGTPDFKVRLVK